MEANKIQIIILMIEDEMKTIFDESVVEVGSNSSDYFIISYIIIIILHGTDRSSTCRSKELHDEARVERMLK